MAVAGYLVVSVLFCWPLPRQFSTGLLGSPSGDLAEYIWNIWVFRHELLSHHSSPFFTSEVLSLTPPAALTLQNYTAFADVLALPLLPWLGTVATFNLVSVLAPVASAYGLFVYAKARTGDPWAAWIAGAAFGFSSYMMARQTAHISLVLAAPLPIFGLLLYRIAQRPSYSLAVLSGLVVAWAFVCDPYYAVYCLFILLFMVGYSSISLDFRPLESRSRWWITLIDLGLTAVAGIVVAIAVSGGGTFSVSGVRVSATQLYTPMLVLSVLAVMRWAAVTKPRFSRPPINLTVMRFAAAGALAIVIALAPALIALASPVGSPLSASPWPLWRSSAPGLDVIAYLLPNPLHPWAPASWLEWLQRQPNGGVENAASLSWVALLTVAVAAWRTGSRPHGGWLAFTILFAVLALGPFVWIAGMNTHLPTPWALIRYLPLIGAARMPTRIAVLATLGLSMLLAMSIQRLRQGSARPNLLAGAIALLLLFELWPAPRLVADGRIPQIFQIIADDPRVVRVLDLPFGLRDGLSSRGDHSAIAQYHQTAHGKPIVGGYLSRLPPGEIGRYEALPLMRELLDLSEGKPLSPAQRRAAVALGRKHRGDLNIGWVVVETPRTSPELLALAADALGLEWAAAEGRWTIYRSDPSAPHGADVPSEAETSGSLTPPVLPVPERPHR